ncbi:MAG: anaerobic ribonucleoside-triphosphate reductase activating protein [Oscillospiraceae bacterium]|nr:anaerobic ribonucleoside-triphosphate reductase activating protein [Oscillospiraceae bacterium]
MKIYGLQKLTLLDFPDRMACTVFTGGCNMRCPFCHNAGLVLSPCAQDLIPEERFFAFLQKRKGILDGVCITGGEPCLQPDLADFIRRIREGGFAVKLDTNGSFPDVLQALLQQGLLDYVAMDVKNAPARYAETCGVPGFDPAPVERSVRLLQQSGVPFELRTTVVAGLHTQEDLLAIGRWMQGAPRYYLQNFVDSGATIEPGLAAWPPEQLRAAAQALRPFFGLVEVRGI